MSFGSVPLWLMLRSVWDNGSILDEKLSNSNEDARFQRGLLISLSASSVRYDELEWRESMLKRISFCFFFFIWGVTSPGAQRQEAVLQRKKSPRGGVEALLPPPKSPAVIVDLGGSPE